jgi:hypothetical protein
MITVRIENAYSDGHGSTREVELPEPTLDWASWWEDVVWPETGDGHAIGDPHVGSCYTATIIGGEFDGKSHAWND